jgi:hypothetical protein
VKLHVDLETFELIEGPGFRNPVTTLRFKRGDAAKLEVAFLRDGTTPEAIGDPVSLEMRFGVKPRNRYDVGYLVHTADWTMPAPETESPVYQCSPSFNTEELNSALNVGSATATELSEITLMGEITWREGSAEPTSTRTFLVIVENDVNRGDEGVPDSAEPAYPVPEGIELVARKGVANGYAGLDSGGKVPAAQLAITAASISDSTTTGRALIKATSAASARSTIGAMANPSLSGAPLHGLNQSGSWVGITQGQRAVLYSPYDYASYPLPQFFKGLALYVLDPTYSWYGYTLADLVSYMESYHGGSAFWGQVLTQGTGEWTIPGFAVLNLNGSSPIPVGALFSWPVLTSQPGRQNPGSEVYLDPNGMATLRFLNTGVVSVHGDLSTTGGGYGSYYPLIP